MQKVIIYPGRFQPMLSHHAEVYKQLENQFPDAKVYVGTSNKVEGEKSPFDFGEKQQIIATHGIPAERVLMASRPYHKDDYPFDEQNTVIIFAVGEKDTDRFPMNNVDSATGLDMTVRGEPRPKYYQMINTISDNPMPMSDRGYIYIAPSIERDEEVASASAFRKAIQDAPDVESAKQIFNNEFLNYDESVFDMVYNKIKGSKMNEDLNILKQLAGLNLGEDAPIEFETNADPKNITFLEPSKSSAQYSIANRFPEGSDPNDPEVKKEEFIQALIKSPEALLSEINERIDPKDPNGEAVGVRLNKIIDNMDDKGIASLDNSDKAFVLEIVKSALANMSLEAGDDSPDYEGEPDVSKMDFESVDLSDVREDYEIEEAFKWDWDSPSSGYDDDAGYTRNFQRWAQEAQKERSTFGDEPFNSEDEMHELFQGMMQQKGIDVKQQKKLDDEISDREHQEQMARFGKDMEDYDPKNPYESEELSEGGNAWDIMITDAQDHIVNCTDDDECIQGLEAMKNPNPDNFDDELANDVVDNYIEAVQKEGLRQVQAEIEGEMQEPNFEEVNELKKLAGLDEKSKGLYYYVNKRKKAGTSRSKDHPDAPKKKDWENAAKTAKESVDEAEGDDEKGLKGKFSKAFTQGWGRIKKWPAWGKLAAGIGITGAAAYSLNSLLSAIKNNWPVLTALTVGGVALKEYLRKRGMEEAEAARLQKEWDLQFKKELLAISKEQQRVADDLKKKSKISWDDYDTEPDWLQQEGQCEPSHRKGKKKKKESFDPSMEPSKKELAINHMMDGDFDSAGEVLGGNGDDVMDEWSEYCSMRGLDRKDALDDVDHVENCVDEMMSSMDDKDFPYEMESLEEGSMTFTDFVKQAKDTNKLNVIRDRELIIKAYELYLKGVGDTPGEAIDMAQAHMDNMAFEAIKEYNELRKLSGLTTLKEDLEGIELPEDDGDIEGKGAGENKGRYIGNLVGLGLSVPVAFAFLKGIAGIIAGTIAPGQPLFRAFKLLFRNPSALGTAEKVLLTNAGITVIGLPIIYKMIRWASKTFGGALGKAFDIKGDKDYDPSGRAGVMDSKEGY